MGYSKNRNYFYVEICLEIGEAYFKILTYKFTDKTKRVHFFEDLTGGEIEIEIGVLHDKDEHAETLLTNNFDKAAKLHIKGLKRFKKRHTNTTEASH